MQEVTAHVDGLVVRLMRTECGDYPRYKAECRDEMWGRYSVAFAENGREALTKLSEQTGLDLDELLITFGIEGAV